MSCRMTHQLPQQECRSLPVESLVPYITSGELVEIIGVAAVSASAAFTAGRMTLTTRSEGK